MPMREDPIWILQVFFAGISALYIAIMLLYLTARTMKALLRKVFVTPANRDQAFPRFIRHLPPMSLSDFDVPPDEFDPQKRGKQRLSEATRQLREIEAVEKIPDTARPGFVHYRNSVRNDGRLDRESNICQNNRSFPVVGSHPNRP